MAGQVDTLEALGRVIVDSAFKVHKHLGPGLPESVYEHCLAHGLGKKAVEKMLPVYQAQLLTYLKISGKRVGFLINFNVPLIRDGIRRFVL